MKLHLLVDYYKNPYPERASELDFCFLENTNSKEFDHIHVFKSSPLPEGYSLEKTIINEVSTRLAYQYYFDYAKNNIPKDDIIVLCNSDIFFDESILLVKELDLSNKVLALTRFCPYHGHWVDDNNNIIPYGNQDRSQDVWIWKNPLDTKDVDFNFNIGTLGCDNKVAHQFHQAGYQVWNPSYSIICYHKHKERDDDRDHYSKTPKVWLPRPYLFPISCLVEQMMDKNYNHYISIEHR
jgi:hypothetical protein